MGVRLARLGQALTQLRTVRWSVGYIVLCLVLSGLLAAAPTHVQRTFVLHASTNLHNLWHGHLLTLLASAFVVTGTPVLIVLLGGVLIAAGERSWGPRRAAATFLTGHVGATLVVAAGLSVAAAVHHLPHSLTHAEDVGLSYGAVAVAGALTARLGRVWAGAWLLLLLSGIVLDGDFTDWGHLVALLIGLTLASRLPRPARRQRSAG